MKKTLVLLAVASAFTGSVVAADRKFDAFMGRVVGNQTTVSFAGNGTPLITSSAGLGTPALGNMGLSRSGSGVVVSGNVAAPVPGTSKTVPVIARAPITRGAFIRGIGLAAANPLVGIGLAIAAPSLADWLLLGGTKINPSATSQDDAFLRKETYFNENGEYQIIDGMTGAHKGWTRSLSSAIGSSIGDKNAYWATLGNPAYPLTLGACDIAASRCYVHFASGGGQYESASYRSAPSQGANWLPASMDDVAEYFDTPEAPSLTPQVVYDAVEKAGINPFGVSEPAVTVTGPSSVPGEKTTTSEPVKLIPGTTTVAPPGTAVTEPGTKTTVKDSNTKLDYSGADIKAGTSVVTNTTITNNITNQTINEGDTITETEEQPEIEVCGLPGTPACKIDETGTPEAKEDTAEADAKKALKPLDDLIANPQSALPTLPTINWAFTLPSGCAPIALPAFDPWLQEIDVCAFQPMFHDIMTFVWVLGGIFGAIGTFWRNTFSQG